MQKVIVLFGKPGSGKGSRLSEFLEKTDRKFDILSVGQKLRQARDEQTELGKKAAPYMESGDLVPDDIINGIVIESLKKSEIPVIADGFPRTVAQAQAMLDAGVIPVVINFHLDDEIIIERCRCRIVCQNSSCGETYSTDGFKSPEVDGICDKCGSPLGRRPDDDPEVVKNRLAVYQEKTFPVVDLFKNSGVEIYHVDTTITKVGRQQFADIMNNL